MGEKLWCWGILAKGEKGDFVPLQNSETKKKASGAIPATQPHTQKSPKNGALGEIRFLPDPKYLKSCYTTEPDPRKPGYVQNTTRYPGGSRLPAFKSRLAELERGHRMFRTTNHYLGLGPVSSAKDDEVWVLLGANVPMVLRRLDHGRYQVIGEAYVYDIMHGEAIRGDVPPVSFVLV